jgi:hypothetical protein
VDLGLTPLALEFSAALGQLARRGPFKNVNMRLGKLGRNRQMLAKPESAYFVIADISGYTSFLHALNSTMRRTLSPT